MRRIIILANGPGELWCWARPMIPSLRDSGFEVSLRLLPCQYAAGNEAGIASRLGAVEVLPPGSIFGTILKPEKEPPSAILQMGGDLLFGLALSRKNRVPLLCYTYGPKPLLGMCDKVFTAFRQIFHTEMPESDKVIVAGDLVADSLLMDSIGFAWSGKGGFRTVFFPGSRSSIRSAAMPFIRSVMDSMKTALPGMETVSVLSPFASSAEISEWGKAGLNPSTAPTGSILRGADLAITQPGTNTLEIAYSGTPGLVVLPFSFLRHVPLSGLKGAVASLPFIGPPIKEMVLRSAGNRRGFLAWPNRIAGREIMPEIVGDVSPEDVARVAVAVLLDGEWRGRIREGLREMTQSPGCAAKIAGMIAGMVG